MPSASSPDTPSTTSEDTSLKRPRIPYKPKGFGTIAAALIVVGYLYFSRIIFARFWPYVLENIPEHYIMLASGLFIHTGLAIFNNLIMYAIYKIKLPFFERYRISDKPWPWESDPQEWNRLLKRTLKTLAFSHFVVVPALMVVDGINGLVMRIDVESLPSIKEMISQILFFMITDDFLFYWSHRTLHHPKLYPYIHKIHHEYTVTVSIAGEYAHPLEFLFGNIIPMNAGAKILGSRVHILTYFLWGMIKLVESIDAHCGYEFSWSPYKLMLLGPKTTLANYHDFHHSHNVGNYSSQFTFWDTLFGTNKRYFEYLARKEKTQQWIAEKVQKEQKKE